jgi:hypothetical protein
VYFFPVPKTYVSFLFSAGSSTLFSARFSRIPSHHSAMPTFTECIDRWVRGMFRKFFAPVALAASACSGSGGTKKLAREDTAQFFGRAISKTARPRVNHPLCPFDVQVRRRLVGLRGWARCSSSHLP